MSEKSPQFERPPIRVVGKAPEEEKERVSKEIGRRFTDAEITDLPDEIIERIKQLEYEKRPEELDFINSANKILNDFLKKYGLESFDISEKNIHIIPQELYRQAGFEGDFAVHRAKQQLIAVNAGMLRKSPFLMAKSIFHEMTHLKSFVSFDIAQNSKDPNLKNMDEENPEDESKDTYLYGMRRGGLEINESYRKSDEDESYRSFVGLNEAVVAELTQIFGQKVFFSSKDNDTQREQEWLNSEKAQELKNKVAQRLRISAKEVDWVNERGEYFIASYRQQRKVFIYMLEEIASDMRKSKEEIQDIFFKAHFDGNILEIAHLIEKTFGKNTFRVVGMMDGTSQSAVRLLDYLRKQRILMKKGR